jgi:hypothetical protein
MDPSGCCWRPTNVRTGIISCCWVCFISFWLFIIARAPKQVRVMYKLRLSSSEFSPPILVQQCGIDPMGIQTFTHQGCVSEYS